MVMGYMLEDTDNTDVICEGYRISEEWFNLFLHNLIKYAFKVKAKRA